MEIRLLRTIIEKRLWKAALCLRATPISSDTSYGDWRMAVNRRRNPMRSRTTKVAPSPRLAQIQREIDNLNRVLIETY